MKKKIFSEDKKMNVPNSTPTIKKKEKTGLVRINQDALDILKLNAVMNKTTMKEYVEKLIYQDNENK